jgi:hypothetical protein
MHAKEIIKRVQQALSSDNMSYHGREIGYSGKTPSTHGGELSVEHVLHVMKDCVPKKFTRDVDKIIDMGCGGGMVCVTLGLLFRRKAIIGVDNCESRIAHFESFAKELQLRNVVAVNCDWNKKQNRKEWAFMEDDGKVLIICNNFNFSNDMTQENMERLITERCKPGTLILSYTTAFASRGEETRLLWSEKFTFPREYFSWAAVDKVVYLTIHEVKEKTDRDGSHHTRRML